MDGLLRWLVILALVWSSGVCGGGSLWAGPNVVLVMTDDQGYGDLACHGNEVIHTPNLDRLYAESVRLEDFHVDPACAPTRASLMTGRTAHRAGLWHVVMGRTMLHSDEVTMAEVFRAGGYRTAMFGKWHLGDNYPMRPQDQGFEEVWTFGGGVVGHTPDYWMNDYFDDRYLHNGEWQQVEGYCTDVWIDKAIDYLAADASKPAFVYLPLNAPHSPFEVPERFEALYRERENVPDAAFYGMITAIDEAMGRLEEALVKSAMRDDTILIFMTDNGTSRGVVYPRGKGKLGFDAGMRGKKGSPYEGGHRVPCFVRWPGGGIEGGRDVEEMATAYDLLPTLCDLCGVDLPAVTLDGVSLAPLLRGEKVKWQERTLVAEVQLVADRPVKWQRTAVMTERWRLVNEVELYDMQADFGQQRDVAQAHPEVVAALTREYGQWWQRVAENHGRDCRLVLGGEEENPTEFTCYYWNNQTGEQRDMPWAHTHIVAGPLQNGYWRVEVAKAGKYVLRLRRWPEESGLGINDHADHLVPPEISWHPLEPAKMVVTRAKVRLGELEKEVAVASDAKVVEIVLEDVPEGVAELQTWLRDDEGKARGAYYVEVEAVE